jgi:hypothetical protein
MIWQFSFQGFFTGRKLKAIQDVVCMQWKLQSRTSFTVCVDMTFVLCSPPINTKENEMMNANNFVKSQVWQTTIMLNKDPINISITASTISCSLIWVTRVFRLFFRFSEHSKNIFYLLQRRKTSISIWGKRSYRKCMENTDMKTARSRVDKTIIVRNINCCNNTSIFIASNCNVLCMTLMRYKWQYFAWIIKEN